MTVDHTTRWRATLAALGAHDDGTLAALLDAYAEPQRAYHTLAHLDDCLAQLDRFAHLAERRAEVELALWFHDAVYDVRSSTNEADSAAWARRFLEGHGVAEDVVARVEGHVLATGHADAPPGGDAALVVDVDLSILGRDEETYDRFEAQVREEYAWVPGPLFRAKRREILAGFLARPRLYVHDEVAAAYDAPARANLARAIEALA